MSKRVIFFIGLGLLPLWAAIAFIAIAGLATPESLIVTPWVLIPAIPACGVTMLIAVIGIAIYDGTTGEPKQKYKFAAIFVCAGFFALFVIGSWYWMKGRQAKAAEERENDLVQQFVQRHPEVRKHAGESFTTFKASYRSNRGELTFRYEVPVQGAKYVYALVDIERTTTPATFRLRCITPVAESQRDLQKDPCQAGVEEYRENELVQQFVQRHPEVRKHAGEPFTTSKAYYRSNGGELTFRYEVAVKGAKTLYALVDVERTTTPATFKLRCLTPVAASLRDLQKDPCQNTNVESAN